MNLIQQLLVQSNLTMNNDFGGHGGLDFIGSGLVGINNNSPVACLHVKAFSASTKTSIFQGASSQTSDIVDLQDASNNNLFIFDKKGRPITGNTTPTIAAGAGAGTTPTVSVAGTDVNGVITVLTGTTPSVSAIVVTLTFSIGYASAPKIVILKAANTAANVLSGNAAVFVDSTGISTTKFDLTVGSTALTAATTFRWYYQVLG